MINSHEPYMVLEGVVVGCCQTPQLPLFHLLTGALMDATVRTAGELIAQESMYVNFCWWMDTHCQVTNILSHFRVLYFAVPLADVCVPIGFTVCYHSEHL